MTLHDIKVELVRTRTGSTGTLESSSLKKVDVQKLNEYCRLGVAMFTHFNSFYQASSSQPSGIANAASLVDNCECLGLSLENIDSKACWTPDEGE